VTQDSAVGKNDPGAHRSERGAGEMQHSGLSNNGSGTEDGRAKVTSCARAPVESDYLNQYRRRE
jgi:hypothetical protein